MFDTPERTRSEPGANTAQDEAARHRSPMIGRENDEGIDGC